MIFSYYFLICLHKLIMVSQTYILFVINNLYCIANVLRISSLVHKQL